MHNLIGLPVIENANARQYGFATKLVPVFLDGVQTAWEQVHIHSRTPAVRRNSPQALRAKGYRAPFVDYDPIQDEGLRVAAAARFKPVWTGD